MPQTKFVFYADKGNVAPVIEWLDDQPKKVQEKVIAGIQLLSQLGHEARRPLWAPLRDGIFELRIQHQNVHYRILSFFHGRQAVVLAHGCTKEGKVDSADIDRAVCYMERFKANPRRHTYVEHVDATAKAKGREGTDTPDA